MFFDSKSTEGTLCRGEVKSSEPLNIGYQRTNSAKGIVTVRANHTGLIVIIPGNAPQESGFRQKSESPAYQVSEGRPGHSPQALPDIPLQTPTLVD